MSKRGNAPLPVVEAVGAVSASPLGSLEEPQCRGRKQRDNPAAAACARLVLYSNDADEPVPVHVEGDGDVASFWVDPRVQRRRGFSRTAILRISRLAREHREQIIGAWADHSGA